MMANPRCPQGNRDPRAEPRPVLLWQGPVQHAAVREAAVKGSLGGGPDAAGGCTGCLTAPCQARHSWVRGVEVPATATQPDSPQLLSWGPLPPTAPLHAQRLCQDLLPPHASPLTVLGQLEQTTADRDPNNRNSASWCWRPEAQPATGPRPLPASPSSRRPAPCSVDAAARLQGRQRPISATPRSHGRSVSHPPLPPS